ncbi:PREDICTED: nucleoporin Nup37-like [Priapulus caudatus]|uniref:Nucleoporin Nup37-like n=1 Tax=Priapulus caudatus TaxID=37621 RepID=A0ABM1E1I9_PRICU|nr:PREDICTED: nucleoporin Nup37-like [Priapulus caudatus]
MRKIMKADKSSTFSIKCDKAVHVVEFCPYEWADNLFAYGTVSKLTIGKLQEDQQSIGFDFEELRSFSLNGARPVALGWSPETSLTLLPRVIKFATANHDFSVRIYSSHLTDDDKVQVAEGHQDYVNDVVFEPHSGERLASVGDDRTCIVWDPDGNQLQRIRLCGEGVTVRWHPQQAEQLLVAERKGCVRILSLQTERILMSLAVGPSEATLFSADWCPLNPLLVCAAVTNKWHVWDMSKSNRPITSAETHVQGARFIRWCSSDSSLVAVAEHMTKQLRVYSLNSPQPVLSTTLLCLSSAPSWHNRIPLVAMGMDRKVYFWSLEKKKLISQHAS